MDRLRVPLWLTTIYLLLVGISAFSPSIASSVYGYEVKDPGVLLVLSASLLGTGVILWGIASDPKKHESLASVVIISLLISVVFLLWGWTIHLFTLRNVAIPVIIDIVLAGWIWSARS
jgi:hypothetical protein